MGTTKSIIFYPQILTVTQNRVLKGIGAWTRERNLYLGGGTALAIYFGHRQSLDFDWFTEKAFGDPLLLAKDIERQGVAFNLKRIDRGTLYGTISRIRNSFLEYHYPLLKKPLFWDEFSCLVGSLPDLACMKLSAVAQRGSKKDFIDLFALGSKAFTLKGMLRFYQKKFNIKDIGHVLYGLTYFDEADQEPMPRMIWDTRWKIIRDTIREWVRKIS